MRIDGVYTASAYHKLSVLGREGEIGEVHDILLDAERWVVRYLLMEHWASGRIILLSPLLLGALQLERRRIELALYQEEIEGIPRLDPAGPLTRSQEQLYNLYFCLPDYWKGTDLWGDESSPAELAARLRSDQRFQGQENGQESHLFSARELTHYTVAGQDGEAGRLEDQLVEVGSFAVRYLLLQTAPEAGGRKVLLSPAWVQGVSRSAGSISLRLTRQTLADAPEYEPGQALTPALEKLLAEHYGSR
jgi:hypothetical protein